MDTNAKLNVWAKCFPQTELVNCSKQSKDPCPLKILFVAHPFFRRNIWLKKLKNWPTKHYHSFLCWLSFFFSFQQKVYFFKHFYNNSVICIHIFLKISYSICLVIRNQSFPCLNFWIYSYYRFLIIKNTTHDLCILKVKFCIIIDTIKIPTQI